MLGLLVCRTPEPITSSCKTHRQADIFRGKNEEASRNQCCKVLAENDHMWLFLLPLTIGASLCDCSRFIHRAHYSIRDQWQLPRAQECDPLENAHTLIVAHLVHARQRRRCAGFWGERAESFTVFGYDLLFHANRRKGTSTPSAITATATKNILF